MQLQLMDDQIAYLLAAAVAKPEDAVLQGIASLLKDNQASQTDEIDEKFRKAADDIYGRDGEIEIDEGAPVSKGSDPGVYVQAWIWVTNSQAGITDEEDEDQEDDDIDLHDVDDEHGD
jgi:hypothetical protein